MVGIFPPQLWDMELWEFNACVRAHNKAMQEKAAEQITTAWLIGAFSGLAFAGKLKPLNSYLKPDDSCEAPRISKEEFEEKLRMLEERKG